MFVLPKEQKKEKNNKKVLTLCLDMIQSIEIKLNTIFMSDILYTYDMYNYNIKYNAEFFL